jgi:hypothetical protein
MTSNSISYVPTLSILFKIYSNFTKISHNIHELQKITVFVQKKSQKNITKTKERLLNFLIALLIRCDAANIK